MLIDNSYCEKVIIILNCLECPYYLWVQVVDIVLPWKLVVQRDSKRKLIIIITSTTSSIILLVSIIGMVIIIRLWKEVKILCHIQEGTRSSTIPRNLILYWNNKTLYHHFKNIQTIEAMSMFSWSTLYGDLRVVKERCEAQSLFVCGVKSCHKRFRSFKQVGTRWIWGCVQGVYSYRFLGDSLCFCAWKWSKSHSTNMFWEYCKPFIAH